MWFKKRKCTLDLKVCDECGVAHSADKIRVSHEVDISGIVVRRGTYSDSDWRGGFPEYVGIFDPLAIQCDFSGRRLNGNIRKLCPKCNAAMLKATRYIDALWVKEDK